MTNPQYRVVKNNLGKYRLLETLGDFYYFDSGFGLRIAEYGSYQAAKNACELLNNQNNWQPVDESKETL